MLSAIENSKSDGVDEKFSIEAELKDVSASFRNSVSSLKGSPPNKYRFFKPWKRREEVDLDAVATQPSVYDDPAEAKLYHPHPRYENLHRFDPAARWSWREEKNLVRKIDWKIMTWVHSLDSHFSMNS